MSLKAMVWVLENSEAKLGDRLVLLALAEHAGDDGEDTYPSQETLARKSGLSERQVRRCLVRLEESGLIERDGMTRYGTICWRIKMTPDNMSARTSATETVDRMSPEPSFEPSLVLVEDPEDSLLTAKNPRPLPRARVSGWKVDRQPVTPAEYNLAEAVLGHWNIIAKQDLTARDWLAKIIMRIREHPELTSEDHYRTIYAALHESEPWWTDHPSPSVVYGNGAQFERCLTAARNGPVLPKPPRENGAMRYGRGMTPGMILDATRGLK